MYYSECGKKLMQVQPCSVHSMHHQWLYICFESMNKCLDGQNAMFLVRKTHPMIYKQ